MPSLNTLTDLSTNSLRKVAASLERISSGNRLTRASDDVAALVTGTALNDNVITLRSALNNTTQSSSLLQVADGALAQQIDILQRQKALATQASSGQLTDANRSALNQEFQALSDQLNQLAGTTNFNGVKLLDGSSALAGGALNFTVGSAATDQISVAVSDTSTTTIFAGASLDISSQATAAAASATIDSALAALTSARANIGALQSRFDTASNAVTSALQNQESARSALLDTDIAAESTTLASALVQQQAGIATKAQANKLQSGLLKLLS